MIVIMFYEKNSDGKLEEVARMLGETGMNLATVCKVAAEQNVCFHGKNTTLYVAIYEEYFKPKSQYAGGYTSCIGAVNVSGNQIVEMREVTPEEVRQVDKYHGKYSSQEEKALYGVAEIAIKIKNTYIDVSYAKAEMLTGVSVEEIKKVLEGDPIRKHGKFLYYEIGDYAIRKVKS